MGFKQCYANSHPLPLKFANISGFLGNNIFSEFVIATFYQKIYLLKRELDLYFYFGSWTLESTLTLRFSNPYKLLTSTVSKNAAKKFSHIRISFTSTRVGAQNCHTDKPLKIWNGLGPIVGVKCKKQAKYSIVNYSLILEHDVWLPLKLLKQFL